MRVSDALGCAGLQFWGRGRPSSGWKWRGCCLQLEPLGAGARRFPVHYVHTLYGSKTPWGLARIWRRLLAKNLSPLNSELHKEPLGAENPVPLQASGCLASLPTLTARTRAQLRAPK